MAVIDEGHSIAWLPQTASKTWVGVDCASGILNECVGFASGLVSQVVRINTLMPAPQPLKPAFLGTCPAVSSLATDEAMTARA